MSPVLLFCWFAGSLAQSPLPKYVGPKPPWPYRGFDRFPAHYFGANGSGLESAARLELVAKHQFAGYGWQQNYQSVGQARWRYYQQEVSLAQMAARLAAFVEFSPPSRERQLQAIFVYRHMEVAEWYFQTSAAAFHDPGNRGMFLHDKQGRICWDSFDDSGPFWNFSDARVADWFIEEIGGELTREAGIQAVFFDETDYLYCGGPPGNCTADVADGSHGVAQYRAKIQMLRRLTLKLNAAGIWPIYSSYNGYLDTPWRKCLLPYDEYYTALHDVGWFRFYEYGFGAASPNPSWDSQAQFTQALKESALGLPVIVHPYPDTNPAPGQSAATLPLAMFLLAQSDYWYFGVSSGWYDADWHWWNEYDAHYGRPLGPATRTTEGASGWRRNFEGCTVFVSKDLKWANVSFHSTRLLV